MHSFNFILLAASLLPASLLSAQSPAPTKTPTQAPADTTGTDAILATWLHTACTNEIALAGIAVTQSKNGDVRAFAQLLVAEHTAFATKLQAFAIVPKPAKVGEAVQFPNGRSTTDASAHGSPAAAGSFDHAGLIRELGAKCLATESKKMVGMPPAEFDRSFSTMQIATHEKGVDMLTVFRTHASPSLVATIDEGLKIYGAHHVKALSLHKKLGDVVVESRSGR